MINAVPAGKPFTLKKEMFSPAANTFTAQKKEFATNLYPGHLKRTTARNARLQCFCVGDAHFFRQAIPGGPNQQRVVLCTLQLF